LSPWRREQSDGGGLFQQGGKGTRIALHAISRGIDLHSAIPVRVLDGLALDGLDPANSPRALTPADANGAREVPAFDAVPAERSGQASVTYWSACRLASTTTTRHGTRSSGASTICFRP